ncbi:hypothetical protein RND71_034496 [Anisodus tanguticus]|uniref:F-box/LRR-repeat protein 15/At3g58940/PEG3-like LRR domain-containing protein n=1 Tax=Anisodus tanguticus TaxID=243964 RepID=A0AAE1UYF8_9SOLA|nr:hypothetical protein RND71_034496 [Anisodus tanguticus]
MIKTSIKCFWIRGLSRKYENSVDFWYDKCHTPDVDLWFTFKNSSLKNLVLSDCQLNPSGRVSWTGLISLSISHLKLTDGVMENILSGCSNLESLQLEWVCGLRRLEISSEKLTKLILKSSGENLLEISAPYVKKLQILDSCNRMALLLRNVSSLVTAFKPELYYCDREDKLERVCNCFKELLQSVAHVENLELGPNCVEVYSYSSLS